MDMQELRYFVAAADLSNYSAAASCLFVSRQAVTKGIRKIEAEIGRPLFEADGKHLILTAEGSALLEDARPIVDAYIELCQTHLNSTPIPGNKSRASLHVHVTEGWDIGLASNPVSMFHTAHPAFALYVAEEDSSNVVRAVASKHADIGMLNTHPSLIAGFEYLRLQHIDFYVLAPENHPIASLEQCTAANLDQQHILTISRTNHLRTFVFNECQRQGSHPIVSGEVGTLEMLRDVAAASGALWFGRNPSVVPAPPGIRAVPLVLPGMSEFGTYAIKRQSRTTSIPCGEFWKILQVVSDNGTI